MPPVTQTFPATDITANAKADVQSVPTGQEDYWVAAADMNKILQGLVAISTAQKMGAIIPLLTGSAESINKKMVRLTGASALGLPRATASMSTDLNKVLACALETIEQGGHTSGSAASTAFFGKQAGLLSGASGAYISGRYYWPTASGGFTTAVNPKMWPVALALSTRTLYVNMGGIKMIDGATLEVVSNGDLCIKQSTSAILSLDAISRSVVSGGMGFSSASAFSTFLSQVNGIVSKVNSVLARMTTYKMRP